MDPVQQSFKVMPAAAPHQHSSAVCLISGLPMQLALPIRSLPIGSATDSKFDPDRCLVWAPPAPDMVTNQLCWVRLQQLISCEQPRG